MFDEAVRMFYVKWNESNGYKEQSSLENEIWDMRSEEIRRITGEEVYHNLSDEIVNLACEAEYAGFEAGLRYGVMFMQGVQEGGAV